MAHDQCRVSVAQAGANFAHQCSQIAQTNSTGESAIANLPPGAYKVDAAMPRFKTAEAEANNALNKVNLGQPSATLGSSGFGTIRSLNGDPRLRRMVLKFVF